MKTTHNGTQVMSVVGALFGFFLLGSALFPSPVQANTYRIDVTAPAFTFATRSSADPSDVNSVNPARITIELGDTIVWTWTAAASHTVTSSTGTVQGACSTGSSADNFDSGTKAGATDTYSHTFNSLTPAGTPCIFYCKVHSGPAATTGMFGKITVRPRTDVNARNLVVMKAGTGDGTVTNATAGQTCVPIAAGCTKYDSGTQVVLTATPLTGNTFTGWSGVTCFEGATSSVCTFNIQADTTVTATFDGGGGGGGGGGISLAVGDYNNDTKLDLAVGVSGKNTVTTYTGNGIISSAGAFTAGQVIGNLGAPSGITTGGVKGDVNNDSKTDLIVANNSAKTVDVYLGTGTANPAFATTPVSPSISLADGPVSVVTGDFDGDANLDLAIATMGTTGNVLIYKGDGAGHFTLTPNTIPINISTVIEPTITSVTPNSFNCLSLPVTITIVGTNLIGGSASFALDDGTPLAVSSTSTDNTTVVATVPDTAKAGVHTVVVTYKTATGVSPPITINPRVISISGVDGPVATGSSGSISIYAPAGTIFTPGINGVTITIGTLTGKTVEGTDATSGAPFVYVNSRLLKFYWDGTSLPAGSYTVVVTNNDHCGGTATGTFVVQSVPVQPTISSLSPATVTYGVTTSSAGTVVLINGTKFVDGATITVSGPGGTISGTTTPLILLPTDATNPFGYGSSTVLRFWWSGTSLAPGAYTVTVTNPSVAGGLSVSKTSGFTINPAQPAINTVNPATRNYGVSAAISLSGGPFIGPATVTVGPLTFTTENNTFGLTAANAIHPALVMSTGTISVYIDGASLAIGAYNVGVTNSLPSGGLSASKASAYTITAPQPTLTSLNPATKIYGSASGSIILVGSNFVPGAIITVVGSFTAGPTVVATGQATATTPFVYSSGSVLYFWWDSFSLPLGTYSVTVTNPLVAGGLSVTKTSAFVITAPQPTITQVAPATMAYGSTNISIALVGTNFVPGAIITMGSITGQVVNTGTSAATATTPFVYGSGNILYFWWDRFSLPVGTYSVTVTNPPVAGSLSVTKTSAFVITAPQPTLTQVSPATKVYGGPVGSLAIVGTNFMPGATLTVGSITGSATVTGTAATADTPFVYGSSGVLYFWDGLPLPVGTYNATVTNPSAAGGLSATKTSALVVTAPSPAIALVSPSSVTYNSTPSKAIIISGGGFVVGATITIGTLSGATVLDGAIATAAKPFVFASGNQVSIWWANTSLPVGTYNVTITNPASAGGLSVTKTGGLVVN